MNASLFPPTVAEPRTLRLYQETAIEMVRESLRTGHRRPILQLPTGGGKTIIASGIINLALIKGRLAAIFVVPRISLIEQTVAAFEREGIWNIGVIQGQHFRTNPNAPVQIASAQTLARREIPPADIVIVDECHLQFKSITEWIADPEWQAVPFIGLSATPWAKGLGKTYDDLLMPVSIQELIDEGYLSPFRVFAPPAPDLTAVRRGRRIQRRRSFRRVRQDGNRRRRRADLARKRREPANPLLRRRSQACPASPRAIHRGRRPRRIYRL
jgi:DNA repair protein RadD